MTPLKRHFNSVKDCPNGYYDYGVRDGEDTPLSNSELGQDWNNTDQSWSGVLDELLPFEGGGEVSLTPSDDDGPAENLDPTIGNRIDSWASENLTTSFGDTQTATSFDHETADGGNLVCYGMIYRAAVQLCGDMLVLDNRIRNDPRTKDSKRQKFKVIKRGDDILLAFADGLNLGILNSQVSKAMETIIDRSQCEADAFVDAITLRETIGRSTKSATAVVRSNIYVYGLEGASSGLGRTLSNHKVYLQKPDHPRPNTIYRNPHFYELPGIEGPSLFEEQQELPDKDGAATGEDKFRRVKADIYASLQRSHNLEKVDGNQWLKTCLLEHQQEGLYFMLQRENGPISSEFRLWRPMTGEMEGWYTHLITKRRSRIEPTETGGGILADEMGMGKSLSILALLTKTLEEAQSWAAKSVASEDHPSSKVHSPATLVIVPSALLINTWVNEIKIHLNGCLETVRYHGLSRKEHLDSLAQADIVITTYHTLVTEYRNKDSHLHKITWYRVVLDEAHIIRRQATTFYKAVNDLEAKFRWCLTGTPIQNRLDDVGALIAFVRIRPFDSIAMFKRFVSILFEEGGRRQCLAVENLTTLLDSLCLRRTKDLLHLPARRERTHYLNFTAEERIQYDQTLQRMNRKMRESVGEEFARSKFGMFHIQLQLRILCNHGTFQNPLSWAQGNMDEKEEAMNLLGESSEMRCSVCRQSMPIQGASYTQRSHGVPCGHVLCSECVDQEIENQQKENVSATECPLCRTRLAKRPKQSQSNDRSAHELGQSYFLSHGISTKMRALLKDVQKDLWTTKSIIFSSWTSTLNLVAKHLTEASVPFERIDGECPLSRRQEILDSLAKKNKIPVLIMTTGTGAFGLNLTFANRVFLVEPQWNPSVENQAIARAQRLGQGQHVLVTRYMVRDTVEQEMESQQKRKLRIAELGNAIQTQGTIPSFSSSMDADMDDATTGPSSSYS